MRNRLVLLLVTLACLAAPAGAGSDCFSVDEGIAGTNIKTGSIKVCVLWSCQNCACSFSGTPSVTTTVPLNRCKAEVTNRSVSSCPPSASCPSGGTKEEILVKVKCCVKIPALLIEIPLPPSLFCVEFQHVFETECP